MAAADFLQDLAQVSTRRQAVASTLTQIVEILQTAEAEGAETSGQLGLDQPIQEVQQAATLLKQGTYRLMVLGDMKRGKSTFLNALIGEKLLPSDVNPCTALLTILCYGPEKQVTLHFKDDQPPQIISFETFKQHYTIDPAEAKQLAEQGTEAFPQISHVVVQYPLPLLQQGIELVDTPGLNDTEARNNQVLGYLNDCQAVLFVLDATQPMTLDEQRYLDNYLKDRGLELFFLINGWDRLQTGLMDPEDTAALAAAEQRSRQVFQANLAGYCGERYRQRVFEISALEALRRQLKDQALDGTGLPEFFTALDQFLTHERVRAELQRALAVANRVHRSVKASVSRRIPLLDETLSDLKTKVDSVQGEFGKLESIRNQYRDQIQASCDRNARTISESFKTYILNLENTFEADFAGSQPDLNFLDFLKQEKRQEFYLAFKRAFERYINDRLAAWEFTAKQTIGQAFDELNASAAEYQVAYAEVVEVIHEKLMGRRFYAVGKDYDPEEAKPWLDNIKDVFEDIPGNLNEAIRPFNGFWQSVFQMALAYVCIVVALQVLGLLFSSLFLNIIGVIAAAGGLLAAQAEFVRREFLKATKREFAKHLPRIADEQSPVIYKAVKDCFEAYEERAIDRITGDIAARRVELNNLIEQKQQHEINREQEVSRLQQLERQVKTRVEAIEGEMVMGNG